MSGFVSLVGAGPGHPDHLTLGGARRLREADVVFHDALVSRDVLALAPGAGLVDVGKRRGGRRISQEQIVQLLITAARAGQRVVRLKGGDPFVFGRGGEEAAALIGAGIPFEVVPGITTAVAAPGLAGVPLTHRGCSRGFVVLTGSPIDGLDEALASMPPHRLTLVILMGIQMRAAIVAALERRGWDLGVPCAVIVGASEESWTWRGSLWALPHVEPPPSQADRPGTIVIGDVAALPIVLNDGKWPGAAGASVSAADRKSIVGASHGVAR